MHFSKTRIAPTPSGFLHTGNLCSFLVTAQLARQTGAKVMLRIDDMDRERATDAYLQDIFDTLNFAGIEWDEGPTDLADFKIGWSQVHRLNYYNALLAELAAAGRVYACTCSRTDVMRTSPDGSYPGTCRNKALPLDTPGACWRLKTDNETPAVIKTLSGPESYLLPGSMFDFIVRKKDGFPAYQLTSVADDVLFGVDFVVRGADLLPSTIAQQQLAQLPSLAAFRTVTCRHHPLVTDESGAKLSKSAGSTSIRYLRGKGMTWGDVLTMLQPSLQAFL